MRIFSLVPALLLAAGPIAAAETAADNATSVQEAPVEYSVELVVFLRDAAPAGEYWPEDVERPSPSLAISTVTGGPPPEFPPDLRLPVETPAEPPTSPVGEVAPAVALTGTGLPATLIQPLPADQYKLTPQADALRRQGLQPLAHAAWRQVVGDRDNDDWLWLEGGPLYGLVRISLGRYLHINTDLLLLGPETVTGPRQAIRSQDHRRMRSGELHYLDHPGFGILVQIDRYEAPVSEEEPLMLETLIGEPPLTRPTPGN